MSVEIGEHRPGKDIKGFVAFHHDPSSATIRPGSRGSTWR